MAGLVENYRRLDLCTLTERDLLPGGVYAYTWSRDGLRTGSIDIQAHAQSLHLIYRSRSHGGEWQDVREVVPLLETATCFGGRRRWFGCPGCARACRVLYGGGRFLCRRCRNLRYESQREAAWSRAASRAQKIRMRLGGSANLTETFPPRPKYMHHKTYWRYRALDARLMGRSAAGMEEFLQALKRRIRKGAGG